MAYLGGPLRPGCGGLALRRGLVIRGALNVFTLRALESEGVKGEAAEGALFQCSLKGKSMKDTAGFYNSLAPGDIVTFQETAPGLGLITGLTPRRNVFARFNQKGRSPQALAANIDAAVCVAAPASPPFRPRFIDRVLVQSEIAGVPAIIVVNKIDLLKVIDESDRACVLDRLADYERIGYCVCPVSAKTGEGLPALSEALRGKASVFVGQSGVGKSSLLNALVPGLGLRVGGLNRKYDRGNHTTAQGALFEAPALGASLIDTPGMRRFAPWGAGAGAGTGAGDLPLYFRELAPLAGQCAFGLSCSHTSEPGCRVREALREGLIHPDRYESFVRLGGEWGE